MMKRLIRGLLTSLSLTAAGIGALPVSAQEEAEPPLVISSGREAGGYWAAAQRLARVAEGERFAIEVVASDGSRANLEALDTPESPVNLALAQADALLDYLDSNPKFSKRIAILENIGQECAFLVTRADSEIRSDADLQAARGFKLGISNPGAGTAVTFNYMTHLVPELDNVDVVYTDTAQLDSLLADRTVDGVLMVQRPKEYSAELDTARGHPDLYRFVKIDDSRLQRKLPNGDEVYTRAEIALPAGINGEHQVVETLCVQGLLLVNRDKISNRQSRQLLDVVNYHWMRVYATEVN